MTKEIWKDIPEYEGLYQASTEGKVRSLGKTSKRKNKIFRSHVEYAR